MSSPFYVCSKKGDAVDYQKQLKQMLKDLAKEKDTKTEKELPKMSQVCTLAAVLFQRSVLKMIEYKFGSLSWSMTSAWT